MSDKVLCRYFLHGACKRGESCSFSHSWNNQPTTVCTFYQRGFCSFGDKCRYDHVKLPSQQTKTGTVPSSSRPKRIIPMTSPNPNPTDGSSVSPNLDLDPDPDSTPYPNQTLNPAPAPTPTYTSPGQQPWSETASQPSMRLTLNPEPTVEVESVWSEYNLPATLDSPYSTYPLPQWMDGVPDSDGGLPEPHDGAEDDDDEEEFNRQAAEFSAESVAISQGLASLSFSDHSWHGGRSSSYIAGGLSVGFTPGSGGSSYTVQRGQGYQPEPLSFSLGRTSTLTGFVAPQDLAPSPAQKIPLPAWKPSATSSMASASPVAATSPLQSFIAAMAEEKAKAMAAKRISEGRPLCSKYSLLGSCPAGMTCQLVHGNLCSSCGKFCLHPGRAEESEEHTKSCQKYQQMAEALRKSQEIECGVCLERVLSKPKPSERKFGVLSSCDHSFCIGCIRGWRGGSHVAGMDMDSVVRACPVCRVQSHFVTPSVVWFFSQQDKEDIIKGYKKKLNEIDCRHFDFGEGNCPFGTSCFYKHAYRDGRREEIKLRHLGTANGSTVIAKEVRLSDFLAPVLAGRR